MFFQRKLRATYAGDEKFRPEQMPEKKWLPVIGFTTKRRQKVDSNGKQEIHDEPYLLIIGNNGIMIQVIAFNCKVMIDDRGEVDMVALSQMARNITLIGKALCDKITGTDSTGTIETIQEETGKGPEKPTAEPV
jgi:hypothetical protein